MKRIPFLAVRSIPILLNFIIFLGFASSALAQTVSQAVSCTEFLCDPHNALCGVLCQIIPQLPTYVIGVGVVIAIVYLVFYGISYMMAGDDLKKIQSAKNGFLWAIVGLGALILSYSVIRFAAFLIGVNPNTIFTIKNVANCNCD